VPQCPAPELLCRHSQPASLGIRVADAAATKLLAQDALFYSQVESAKLAGVDPVKYLRAAAEAEIRDSRALLPHEFRAMCMAAR
jgi:hypothetical protein